MRWIAAVTAHLIAVTTLVLVSAITPGPNNLIVLRAASRGGIAAALPAIAGVVLGGLLLVSLAIAGLGAVFVRWPWLSSVIAGAGCVYLVFLGLTLMLPPRGAESERQLPTSWRALTEFQFINPKAWVMVLTVVAAWPESDPVRAFFALAPIFVVIPVPCLLLWAATGGALSRYLAMPHQRRRVDIILGALLSASAILLLV